MRVRTASSDRPVPGAQVPRRMIAEQWCAISARNAERTVTTVVDAEFDRQASLIADQIPSLPARDRIAAACRGSGNPVALSWLAEGLHLDESTTVIDLGAGLGGPSAWLHEHFDCPCINVEVSAGAAAAQIFGTPTIRGCAEHAPIRSDSVDVALLLGVLSVVAHPAAVLNEAFRVADRLGVLDYCSATCSAVHVGGSTFVSAEQLHDQLGATGWNVVQMVAVTVPAPITWTDAAESIDVELEATEAEVIDAIRAGQIVPVMLHATRRTTSVGDRTPSVR